MTRLLILMLLTLPAMAVFAPARAQDSVLVRTGNHDSYQRLVVEWPGSAPTHTLKRDGNAVTVRFDTPGTAALDQAGDLENIAALKQADGDRLTLMFNAPEGSELRELVIGRKVIIDVYDPPGGRAAASPVEEAKAEAIEPAAQPTQEETIAESPSEPVEEAIEEDIADAPAPVEAIPPEAEKEEPVIEAAQIPAEAEPAPQPAVPAVVPPALEPHVMTVTATKKFGLAVFERGDFLWVVTDDSGSVPPTISGPQVEKFGLLQRFDIKNGSAYRLKKPQGVGITAEGGGLRWRLVFSPNPKEVESVIPERLAPVAASSEPPAPRRGISLLWSLHRPRSVLHLTDPDIGDTVTVVTLENSAPSARRPFDFVELETLPSYVGLAYVPLAEDVVADLADNGVRLGRGVQDLSLSMTMQNEPQGAAATEMSVEEEKHDLPPVNTNNVYHLARWQMGGLSALDENQNVLMAGLTEKSEEGKVEDLLTLARLMLANNRASEASGYLRAAELLRPAVADKTEFIALRAAAALRSGKPDIAVEDFVKPALNDYMDIPYWRMATFAALEDWQQALKIMPRDTKGINDYPPDIRGHLSLKLAEVSLRGGKMIEAERILADLEPAAGRMDPADNAAWQYLMGEAARQFKQFDKAKQYWGDLAKGSDDYYRVRAGLALTRLLLERNEIGPEQAIDQLEQLRYAWRGDELEALVNYRLGQVYIDNDEYLKGFYVLRNAVSLTPGTSLAGEITQYMTKTFRALFDSDELQKTSPLDAIGVYEEFKELSPGGADGDRIAEQLAERMVDADLLSRAEALLDYQLAHRLQGIEAGRVSLRLAAIRLLNNKPEGALKNLEMAEAAYRQSAEKAIPPEKLREITLLRASALSRSGKAEEALSVLELLPADKVTARLAADISWKNQRWADAADALADLIDAEQLTPERPLTEDQADLILNRGIALNLSGDRVGLSGLREQYGSQMQQTPKKDLFDVVTLPRRFGLIRSRDTIAETINNVELFKDFLETYRKATPEKEIISEEKPVEEVPVAEKAAEEKPAE